MVIRKKSTRYLVVGLVTILEVVTTGEIVITFDCDFTFFIEQLNAYLFFN